MSMGPPPRAVQNLPIGDTVLTVFRTVFGRFGDLVKAALVPFVLSSMLMALTLAVQQQIFLLVLANILTLVPYTLFGVTWFRSVLLGAGAAPQIFSAWQPRHWRFLSYALVITLICWGLVEIYHLLISRILGITAIGESGEITPRFALALLIATVVILYVVLRLSFVFPAIAVDERYGLGDSWRHSRGQGGRLLAAILLIWISVTLAGTIILSTVSVLLPGISGELDAPAPGSVTAVFNLVLLVLQYFLLALTVTLVSTAFRICTGWVPDISGLPGGPVAAGPDEPEEDT